MANLFQVFDLFGEPVYFEDLETFLAECEEKLNAYPVFDPDDLQFDRTFRNMEYKIIRQHYRHLINQLYTIKGEETRIRGEMRFAFLTQPTHIIYASILQQLDDNTYIVRYHIPQQTAPIIREVFLDQIRIVSLMVKVDLDPMVATVQGNQGSASVRRWGVTEAATALPVTTN